MSENPVTPQTPDMPSTVESTAEKITDSSVAASTARSEDRKEKLRIAVAAAVALLIIAGLVASVVLLVKAGPDTAALVRDIFIIFMGLISLLVMVALIILIIQLAVLINLLQNEIKPILHSTTETVNNLRGTTTFISNNLVEPIIKLNEYLAGLRRFLDLIRPGRP